MLQKRKVLVGDKHAEFRLLSLTKRGVITRDVSTGRGKFSADMSTFQEVRPGDLVFCLFDVPETPRTVGLSQMAGMITGAYTIFECKDPLLAVFLEAFYIAMDDRKLLSSSLLRASQHDCGSGFLGESKPQCHPWSSKSPLLGSWIMWVGRSGSWLRPRRSRWGCWRN